MLRFTVRREWQQNRFEAKLLNQPDKISHHLRIIETGERILNYQHVFASLRGRNGFKLLQRHRTGAMSK